MVSHPVKEEGEDDPADGESCDLRLYSVQKREQSQEEQATDSQTDGAEEGDSQTEDTSG